nr:hypothetical protein mv_L232 [Moumouvirus Monve]
MQQKEINKLKLLNSYGVDLSFINDVEIKMYDHDKKYIDFLKDSGIELENIIKILVGKFW